MKQNWIEENSCGKDLLHLNILRRISISETISSSKRILFSRQWSREFFWKECVIANLMDRNSISETHATRIGNSFLKKENSFRQAMKQRVLLERIFNRKSYEQDRNFRNSCHKNPEFFFSRTRILSGKQTVEGPSGKNV